ncbi:TNF receptor-associated factor family protein DDB_G0272098-like isoform X2 [Agrilus planipennis]|uniref:TNF receptor-associated factor family protein DDB_G0272098-like isoform X2 n=1 Tax=Agrilus planipennis TaxID=224129 RepID=A0A7F5RIH6_AGRPL|nr:TNF receptor-associated factor family protein DDB_G0272098-like isoform X2 [Agrilus planipennis]
MTNDKSKNICVENKIELLLNVLDEYVESDIKFEEDVQNQEALYQNPSLNLSKSDNLSTSSVMNDEGNCPYANLPAQQVNTCEKNGPLIKKEKFLFLEHHKKIFAAVQESFFLIYLSEKDVKPIRTIDLTKYEVRIQNNGKNSKKKSAIFEFVRLNKKSYQFIAQSDEEANEWCKAISSKTSKTTENTFKPATVLLKRNLPPLPKIKNKLEANTYEIVDIDVDYTEIESNEGAKTDDIEEKKGKEIPIPLPPRVPEGVSFKSPLNSSKKTYKRQNFEQRSHRKFIDLSNNYDLINFREKQKDVLEWNKLRNESTNSGTYDTINNNPDNNLQGKEADYDNENLNLDIYDLDFEKNEENRNHGNDDDHQNNNSKEEEIGSNKPSFTFKPKSISIPYKKKSYHVSLLKEK